MCLTGSSNSDEKILLTLLPELTWILVLKHVGPNFPALETLSEASEILRSYILGLGRVSLGIAVVPSAFCERIDKTKGKDDLLSDSMLLLLSMVDLKPKINTAKVFFNINFRPEDRVFQSFLNLQSDHLQTLHITCVGLEKDRMLFELSIVMNALRDLKIVRSVGPDSYGYRNSSSLLFQPKTDRRTWFPALEKLTLSLGVDDWIDFLVNGYCAGGFELSPVKHLRFIDLNISNAWWETTEWEENKSRCAVTVALHLFPDTVFLEMPAMRLFSNFMSRTSPGIRNVKRLTLTLPKLGRHTHLLDMCITGYGREICATLFANKTGDTAQFRQQLEEEWNRKRQRLELEQVKMTAAQWEQQGFPGWSLRKFESLEILRVKSEKSVWAPTIVSCEELLNMKSLKVLDFCSVKPMHIPNEMMQKLGERFTVLCG